MLDYTAKNGHKLRESVFVANSVVTGVASTADATAYDATVGLLNLHNTASAVTEGGTWLVPLYVKLTAAAVNTGADDFRFTINLDNVDKFTSGGSVLTGKSTASSAVSGYTDRTPKGRVNAGVLVIAAANAAKVVTELVAAPTILAIDDQIEIWFGEGPAAQDGTTQSRFVHTVPPVWIGPGSSLSFHEWAANMSADPQFQMEVCWVETGLSAFGQ